MISNLNSHVAIREDGTPVMAGMPRFKIEFLAVEATRWGLSPLQIQEQHPDLSLAQIHGALAFYYDNQQEMEERIAAGERYVEEMRSKSQSQPSRDELLERMRKQRESE